MSYKIQKEVSGYLYKTNPFGLCTTHNYLVGMLIVMCLGQPPASLDLLSLSRAYLFI